MISRTMDPTQLNTVANHPDVRPWLGGKGVIDLTPVICNPANIALSGPHGGFVLVCLEPTIYEVHTMFVLEGRGAYAHSAMAEGCEYVFTQTDALEIVTKVPSCNPGAFAFARLSGFSKRFTRTQSWPDIGGPDSIDYFGLAIDDWTMISQSCAKAGIEFHWVLTTLLPRGQFPKHPDDGDAHDRAAGAAYLMALAGNGMKAADTYNRWARLAGYPLISVLSLHPLIMDVGAGVIVEYHQGAMRLVDCPKQEALCLSE